MSRKTSEPDTLDLVLGARIKELRQEQGLSLTALADLAGLSKGHLSDIECGHCSATVKTLAAISGGLCVPPMYLLIRPSATGWERAAEKLRAIPAVKVKTICRQIAKGREE